MRAIVIEENGGPEVLAVREIPDPEPGPGEVRVRLRTAALNHLDLWVRKGLPGVTLPRIPGSEGAGVVDAVGAGVEGIAEGDEVIAYPGQGCGRCRECWGGRESYCTGYRMLGVHRDGTYAEQVVLPAASAVPKPDALDWAEAAAFPLVYLTAWHMLHGQGRLRSGEDVLVMAAGSGVGMAAVQIARHAGARVIATAGSEEKRERALELGAHHAVDYTREGWSKEVVRHTGGRGVDLVFEHTGAAFWEGAMRSLANGGRLVTCGATTGPKVEIDLRFFFMRNLSVMGAYMGSKTDFLDALALAGRPFRSVVDRAFPLADAAHAHEHLASRAAFGKVVLEI